MGGRKALVVATYEYADGGLRRLAAPEHDAEALAGVLEDPGIAGFDVTMLVNQPHHVVGEAIADFYGGARRDDLTLLYFTGHGLKDDEGRFHLAMTNTRRSALMFTAISGAQLNDAMDASPSRRKVLILDCCYSGAFPAGRTAKADEGVHTLERFQGKGRAVLTASDATQYAFEGDDLRGTGTSSVFTRHLVEAIRTGAADLDEDGDITLDELYSYVRDRVVAEMPQQRPKKQEDVDGRILIARNVHWTLPAHLRHAIESPIAAQRLSAVDGLGHLFRTGNDIVRAAVTDRLTALAEDDSKAVCAAATALLARLDPRPAERESGDEQEGQRSEALERERSEAAERERREAAERERREAVERERSEAVERERREAAERQRREDEEDRRGVVSGGAPVRVPNGVAVATLVASAVLIAVSRVLVLESVNGYTADALGWTVWRALTGAVLPGLVACGLLLLYRNPLGVGSAYGLATGSALILSQEAVVWAVILSDANAYAPGPAYWSVVGAWALVGAVAVGGWARGLLAGAARGRGARSGIGAMVVGVCAVAQVATSGVPPTEPSWFAANVGTILFAAVCVTLCLLRLGDTGRFAGLTAVTLFAAWSVVLSLVAVLSEDWQGDTTGAVVRIVGRLVSCAACFVAQWGAQASVGPRAADVADRR